MQRAYLQNDLVVPMPSTDACPGGRVVSLKAGFNEVDDEVAAHPIVARLLVDSENNEDLKAAAEIQVAVAARDAAIGEAHAAYSATCTKIEEARQAARVKSVEAWMKKRDAATKVGVVHNEPHPDPDTARGHALTAQTPHQYTAEQMVVKEHEHAPAPAAKAPKREKE